jgi:DNA-binding transcriptional regulator YiaG
MTEDHKLRKEIRATSGKHMREIREALGYEDYELAQKCNVSTEDIRAFESGDKAPTEETYKKIVYWLSPRDDSLLRALLIQE